MRSGRVSSITTTTISLLEGLHDRADDLHWTEFCRRYLPPLTAFIRRMGIRPHDAEEVAQETLVAFAEGYRAGRYDPAKGRLRTYLMGVAKNKIADVNRRRRKEAAALGGTGGMDCLLQALDERSAEQAWEEEWRDALLRACLEEVRKEVEPKTMRIFELYALEGRKPAEIAEELGVSRDLVYQVKTRVIYRMSELRRILDDCW